MTSQSAVFRAVSIAFLVVVLGGTLVFAAPPRRGGVLRIAATTGPPTVDPQFSSTRATADVAVNVFETLVGRSENFAPSPLLARSWQISDDGKIYTFQLQRGVRFHNGRVMNAEDVKASLERAIQISPRRAALQVIQSVEVVDSSTVRLVLSERYSPLLSALADPPQSILPVEAIKDRAGGRAELIGSGPFRFVEWVPDRHVRLAKFGEYVPRSGSAEGTTGRKEAYVDEVLIIPVPEEGARVAGLETGEYHVVDFLPYKAGRRLASNPKLRLLERKQHMMPFVYFSHVPGRITADVRIRRAIQAALDHEEILAGAADGFGRLNPSFHWGVWESTAGSDLYNMRNPDLASRLLREAGYDGRPLVILTNTSFDVMYRSALVVERQLQRVGFKTQLEVYDWPGSLAARRRFEWDLFFSGHLLQEDPSIIEFHLLPQSSPFAHNNPMVTGLMRQARLTADFKKRRELYEQLQRLLYRNATWIKLFDQDIFQGVQASVQGYKPWPFMRAWNVWLEDR